MEHIIKYYPVGNADCTLIKLDNGKTIIVDCQILADLTDGHGKQVMFDVKADLLKELKRDGFGRPFVDLFISTHPHDDHCKGFAGNFYHGDVANYDKDKNKDEIIEKLVGQVSNSVLWQQSVEYMITQGVDTFVELGPGKSLSGFVKRIGKSMGKEVKTLSVSNLDSYFEALDILKRGA